MSKTVEITDDTFDQEVINSDTPVLVDFWAEWCGPCKAIMPTVEELAEEYDGVVKIAKVDVDSNPKIPTNYKIRGIPALLIFNQGEEVKRLLGALPKAKLKENIDEVLEA